MMAAPKEMAFRFVESTRDWFRERQIGLRLERTERVARAVLREWGPLWIVLIGIVAGWALGRLAAYELSDQLRVSGGFLQLLGLITTAWGLKETRKVFGVPSIREQFARQLGRLTSAWKLERDTFTLGAGETSAGSEPVGFPYEVSPSASVEKRLEALEDKYKQLNQQLIDTREKIKSEARRLDEAVKDERQARHEADAQIQEQLEAFSVGGLHLEIMGLVWLLIGITLATLPGEMAALWKMLPL